MTSYGPISLEGKSLDSPDEVLKFGSHGRASVVHIGGVTVKRTEHEPGWRWSQHNGPQLGAELCPARHVGYVLAGRLGVHLPDGHEAEFAPGDAFVIPPEHDAWTVGSEECVTLDFAETPLGE